MRKSILTVIAIFLCCAAVFAFSKASDSDEAEGFINYYGNTPVEFAGFMTEDGKLYTLAVEEGASFTLEDITALQGTRLHIEGRIEKNSRSGFQALKDGVFFVSSYETAN